MRFAQRCGMVLLLAILTAVGIVTAPLAHADYATGGEGRYLGSIIWAEWGTNNSRIPSAGLTRTATTQVGGSTLTLTCTVGQPTSGTGYNDTTLPMRAYRAGSYTRDGLDNMYYRGGVGTRNTMVSGVGNSRDGQQVRFRVSCTAKLTGPGLAAQGVDLPVSGLVIADAETSDPAVGGSATEFIEVEAPQQTRFHIIDRHRSSECTSSTQGVVTTSAGVHKLRVTPIGRPCAAGPTPVMLANGTSEATITVRGQGLGAAAVGAIINLDYGDAPTSYGAAASRFVTTWSGTGLGSSPTDLMATELSVMNPPDIMLGSTIDSEPVYPAAGNGTSDDAAISSASFDDEDALSGTPQFQIVPGRTTTAQQTVACTGSGYVRGWLDWDINGVFDNDEVSAAVACQGGQATLIWNVPSDATPGDSYLRLRAASSSNELDYATGITVTGEVEDYGIKITAPALTVTKTSDALVGQKKVGDTVTYTVTMTNTGSATLPSARLIDNYSASLDDADLKWISTWSVNGTNRGRLGYWNNRQGVMWTGSLAPGETLVFTYQMTLKLGGDRLLSNVAWGQPTVDNLPANPECTNVGSDSIDIPTGVQCARHEFGLMTVLKSFQSSYNPSPAEDAWTLRVHGNFGGEATDNLREVPGAAAATSSNTFVVPIGEQFTFSENASASLLKAYTLTNADITGRAGDIVTLINQDQPLKLRWRKIDAVDQSVLGGSTWLLRSGAVDIAVSDCVQAPCAGPDLDPAAGYFEVQNLTWDPATLQETTAPEGYELDTTQHQITIDPRNPNLDMDLGALTNNRKPGSLSWTKVEDGTGNLLSGSVWQLTHTDGTQITDIEDCTSAGSCAAMIDQDPQPGAFRVTGLNWGQWRLQEQRAPVGFYLSTRVESVTVNAQQLAVNVTNPFVNTRMPVPVLPLTGGTPSDVLLLGGVGFLALAGALAVLRRRKDRGHEA